MQEDLLRLHVMDGRWMSLLRFLILHAADQIARPVIICITAISSSSQGVLKMVTLVEHRPVQRGRLVASGLLEDCHRQDRPNKISKHRCDRVEVVAESVDAIRLVARSSPSRDDVASPRRVSRTRMGWNGSRI